MSGNIIYSLGEYAPQHRPDYAYSDGGVNSKKGSFGRKTQFIQESEVFTGNLNTWEVLRDTK